MKKALFFGIFSFLLSGCQIIQTMQATPLPINTEIPMLSLEQVPIMPTLVPEIPTPTPVPQTNVSFVRSENLFERPIMEIMPQGPFQKITIKGNIQEEDKLRHSSGVVFNLIIDDYCFFIDAEKKLISADNAKEGADVIVYGSSGESVSDIRADLIVVNTLREKGVPEERADLSGIYGFTYTEHELAGDPSLSPLRVTDAPTQVPTKDPQATATSVNHKEKTAVPPTYTNDLIEDRLNHAYSNRGKYTIGYHGERYTLEQFYNSDQNRSPEYPTRANIEISTNDYPFMDFWYPFVESPMNTYEPFMNWGWDWYLPFLMSVDIDPDPEVSELITTNRTLRNGTNYDAAKGYLRSFGYSVIGQKIFYFYEKENGFGISLDLVDYDLGFDEVPYGYPEQYKALDPYLADDLISFFGHRDGKWYYVELEESQAYSYYY